MFEVICGLYRKIRYASVGYIRDGRRGGCEGSIKKSISVIYTGASIVFLFPPVFQWKENKVVSRADITYTAAVLHLMVFSLNLHAAEP